MLSLQAGDQKMTEPFYMLNGEPSVLEKCRTEIATACSWMLQISCLTLIDPCEDPMFKAAKSRASFRSKRSPIVNSLFLCVIFLGRNGG